MYVYDKRQSHGFLKRWCIDNSFDDAMRCNKVDVGSLILNKNTLCIKNNKPNPISKQLMSSHNIVVPTKSVILAYVLSMNSHNHLIFSKTVKFNTHSWRFYFRILNFSHNRMSSVTKTQTHTIYLLITLTVLEQHDNFYSATTHWIDAGRTLLTWRVDSFLQREPLFLSAWVNLLEKFVRN